MRFSCDLFHFSVGETCCHWGLPVPAATAAVSRRRDEHARVPRALLAAVRPAVPCGAVSLATSAVPRRVLQRVGAVLCCAVLRSVPAHGCASPFFCIPVTTAAFPLCAQAALLP